MTEIVKICKVHGELTKENAYHKKHTNGKYYYECKFCMAIQKKKTRLKYHERYKKQQNIYYHLHSEDRKPHRKLYAKQNRVFLSIAEKRWKEINKEKHHLSQSRFRKKQILFLYDSYITETICRGTTLIRKDIPKNLIEAKRLHLKIKRKLKEIKNGNN